MNLNQLRFVSAVASELSFSRAAARCDVTQPTLSSGIALLEEELGGQIFVRTTRKVELSPFGTSVLPLIENVLRAQTELEIGVRAFYRPTHRLVRVGLSPLADSRLLRQVLEPYEAEHAGVETFLKESFLEELAESLRTAQVDVAIRPRPVDEPTRARVVRIPLYEEDLFYLPRLGTTVPGRKDGEVLLEDVTGETFVLCANGCGLAATTRHLFKQARAKLKEYSGEALTFQVMQEWAELGVGATILPGSKIAPAFKPKARRLMLGATKPARIRFEAQWMRSHAYPAHVIDLHHHFHKRVPKLVAGAANR